MSWTSGFPNPGVDGPDGSLFGIAARPYQSDGSPASGEFVVNTFTLYNQYRNAVTSGPDGQVVVVWESVDSGPAPDFGPSVLGQRFRRTASIFTDGFESGDVSSWSSSVE